MDLGRVDRVALTREAKSQLVIQRERGGVRCLRIDRKSLPVVGRHMGDQIADESCAYAASLRGGANGKPGKMHPDGASG